VQWKKDEETDFLETAPSQSLQQTLKNLDRALKDAFDKNQPGKRFPVFKKKGLNDSYRYPQGFKLQGNRIFLPKIRMDWLLQKPGSGRYTEKCNCFQEGPPLACINSNRTGGHRSSSAGLNKSILDQGWSAFLRMLEYKQTWSGGIFLQVDPKNTSRTCPGCGHVSGDNRKTQTLFQCTECGYTANADHVAAINIRVRGINKYGGGAHRNSLLKDDISHLTTQEPLGTNDQVPILESV
jgi:transposase